MQCIKCKKDIPDQSNFCNWCGRKQIAESNKKMRLPNGYGSVIKLGGRRRKPWAVRVTDGFIEKKQVYRYLAYYETKTEAMSRLANEQICPTSPKANITFSELYKEWKETPAYTDLSKQTQDNYTAAYSHLEPLHKIKFNDIRTIDIQKLIDKRK